VFVGACARGREDRHRERPEGRCEEEGPGEFDRGHGNGRRRRPRCPPGRQTADGQGMKSYILIDGRPNGSLGNVLENMGLNELIGAGWPRASIEFTDRLELRCDDWANLSSLIQSAPGNAVDAFYLGDSSDLPRINGKTLGHEGRIYTLT